VHDFSLNKISNFLGQMNPVLHKHVLKLMSFGEGPLLTIRQRPSRGMVSFFLDLRLWMKPFWGERMINRPTANSYLGGQLFVSLQPRRKLLTFSATISHCVAFIKLVAVWQADVYRVCVPCHIHAVASITCARDKQLGRERDAHVLSVIASQ
jgi:hypothetical protein